MNVEVQKWIHEGRCCMEVVHSSKSKKKGKIVKKWSVAVTNHSDALDLEQDIFKSKSPLKIARSLKQSAQQSTRKKATPFRSAISMLTF